MAEPHFVATEFKLTLLTRDPVWALAADAAGVDRIGVDIERLGKARRQAGIPDARISDHHLHDLAPIARCLRGARAFARLNPPHEGTAHEIETALNHGARSLMLPQFRRAEEARAFVERVRGRAEVLLLLETAEALEELQDILGLPGVDELMVGLNDLSHALGMAHPMQLAASPVLAEIAAQARQQQVAFGFGGLSSPEFSGEELPAPPDLLLARYAELGAHSAWLSRTLLHHLTPATLGPSLERLRARLRHWFSRDAEALALAHEALRHSVEEHLGACMPL